MINNVSNAIYYEICEANDNKDNSSRDKIFLFYNSIKTLFAMLSESERMSFTEFARFNFILRKYSVEEQLKKELSDVRRLVARLKKNNRYCPSNDKVLSTYYTSCKIVAALTETDIPNYITPAFANFINDTEEEEKSFTQPAVSLAAMHCTFISSIRQDNGILLLCNDDAGSRIIVSVPSSKEQMCNMVWRTASLCITNLAVSTALESQYEEENELYQNAEWYATTERTQITLEPDYLVDVTEITDCFNQAIEYPVIPIISKFLNRRSGVAAFKGNIINSFLDELLEDIETDFHSAVRNGLKQKPLQMLTTIKYYKELGMRIETYEDLLSHFRTELYDTFSMLRNFIIDNYLGKNIYTEPSFISNIYGLQGRLDVLAEDDKNSIDIVELKSGKAPNRELHIQLGMYKKRPLTLPLWVGHYVQIICYNMLLQEYFNADKKRHIGFSSILYAAVNEPEPLRSVVDNYFVQNEIITNRNWVVAFMRELALGNLSVLDGIDDKKINMLPKYGQDDARVWKARFHSLSQTERAYFQWTLAFIVKEGFSQKIGLFGGTSHSGASNGFAGLWLQSLEEKMLKGTVLSKLRINLEHSILGTMHIWYDLQNENVYSTSFRKGDICVLYPQVEDVSPTDNQLMRGRIMEIDSTHILVSFRNKLSQNQMNAECYWCLEADYMEVSNRYLYSSLSEFIFGKASNKQAILGLAEPTFVEATYLEEVVNGIEELSAEKRQIILSALAANNYYLIQGPPGTGKTSFVLRYLVQLLLQYTSEHLLVLAYTNRAVDEICSSLNRIPNCEYIRLGNADSSEHIDKLMCNIPMEEISDRVMECKCFVATVATANANPELFDLKEFDTVIIDEAAQILECHIIGLLSHSHRFIMIGDEKQLPAVTSVSESELAVDNEHLSDIEFSNMGTSLFERLLRVNKRNGWRAYSMLCEQSRMSYEIMEVANILFYKGQLRLNPLTTSEEDASHKLTFINTPLEQSSKRNDTEVENVIALVNEFREELGERFNSRSIGIISPWRKQCNAIINRLDEELRSMVTVDTVERFQGSERDIIIYSTATNNLPQLNLLSEARMIDGILVDRKLNVVITRAKRQFIMLGNRELLCEKDIYRRLLLSMECKSE
ncbi:MAG: AAA family ATPase [Ignavibacteria bacterium]|jgi:DNA replication ATP-dependent helicase Dna2|nr:AAA family ATPase [Ignavibacteria bacterium]